MLPDSRDTSTRSASGAEIVAFTRAMKSLRGLLWAHREQLVHSHAGVSATLRQQVTIVANCGWILEPLLDATAALSGAEYNFLSIVPPVVAEAVAAIRQRALECATPLKSDRADPDSAAVYMRLRDAVVQQLQHVRSIGVVVFGGPTALRSPQLGFLFLFFLPLVFGSCLFAVQHFPFLVDPSAPACAQQMLASVLDPRAWRRDTQGQWNPLAWTLTAQLPARLTTPDTVLAEAFALAFRLRSSASGDLSVPSPSDMLHGLGDLHVCLTAFSLEQQLPPATMFWSGARRKEHWTIIDEYLGGYVLALPCCHLAFQAPFSSLGTLWLWWWCRCAGITNRVAYCCACRTLLQTP